MGGIPTDVHGRVVIDADGTLIPGLYAAGETACVSVHGGNRLGTNSLLDLVVFGRRSGLDMVRYCLEAEHGPLPEKPAAAAAERLEGLLANHDGEPAAKLREEMQDVMMDDVGIFRTGKGMQEAVDKIAELKRRYRNVTVVDKGKWFNTDLMEAWELGNLLDLAEVTAVSALNRTESRGAHMREDYDKRNDAEWLKHTLAHREDDGTIDIDYKPVVITKFEPKERVY
jgi:succinate dehydrogenase / fumarate reductase flavoprotein subunit